MARIRTVKPEFWGHWKTARVSRDARLLFLGLLNEADDEGRLLGSPKAVAGAVFPNDDDVTPKHVERWVDELESVCLAHRYEVEGIRYIVLPGFTEHQKVSHPTPSRLPCPSGSLRDPFANSSGDSPEDVAPDLGSGSRNSRAFEEKVEEEFDALWPMYPRKLAKKPALKAYLARRREGVEAEELSAATKNYAAWVKRERKEENFVLHGATFYGPNDRWRDYTVMPEPTNGHRKAYDPTRMPKAGIG